MTEQTQTEGRDQEVELTEVLAKLKDVLDAQTEAQQPKLMRSTMSDAEKAAFISEHGAETYLSLPWA